MHEDVKRRKNLKSNVLCFFFFWGGVIKMTFVLWPVIDECTLIAVPLEQSNTILSKKIKYVVI